MDARAQIDALAEKFPANIRIFMRKELKKLPELLNDSEDVVYLAQGRYEGKQGAVVVTDRRVMLVEEGVFRSRLEDFPYERISSIQTDKGMMFGKIVIFASGNKAILDQIVPKEKSTEIGDYIRSRLAAGSPLATASGPAADDPLDRLKKLAELKDAGILTEEEFASQKAKILGE